MPHAVDELGVDSLQAMSVCVSLDSNEASWIEGFKRSEMPSVGTCHSTQCAHAQQ